MKRWRSGALLCTALLTAAPSAARTLAAQSAPANFRDAIDYPALLQQLRSPLDTTRAAAYYALLFEPSKGAYDGAARVQHVLAAKPALAPRIRRALIATLERENGTLTKHAPRPLAPPFSQYYPHLVASVAALHDVSATSALIGALPQPAAHDGLRALGKLAVPKLRAAAAGRDAITANSARELLGQIGATR